MHPVTDSRAFFEALEVTRNILLNNVASAEYITQKHMNNSVIMDIEVLQ